MGLSDNPGIVGIRLGVEFDESALRLVDVVDGGAFDAAVHGTELTYPYTLFWDGATAPAPVAGDVTLATLRFEILSEAGSDIRIHYNPAAYDALDFDLNAVYFAVVDGSVSVDAADDFPVELIGATPSAFVEVLKGNKNNLTVTVDETFSDGSANKITVTFSIDNNAAGFYNVGSYVVYVDTKGNDQIRQCYIVN